MYFELKEYEIGLGFVIYYIYISCSLKDKEVIKEEQIDEYDNEPRVVNGKKVYEIYCEELNSEIIQKALSELNANNKYHVNKKGDPYEYVKLAENQSKEKIIDLSLTTIEYDITNINRNCYIECYPQCEYSSIFIDSSNKYLNDFYITKLDFKKITFKNMKLKMFKFDNVYKYKPEIELINCQIDDLCISGYVIFHSKKE